MIEHKRLKSDLPTLESPALESPTLESPTLESPTSEPATREPATSVQPVYSASRHAHFLRNFTTHEAAIRAYVRRLMPSRVETDDVMQEVSLVLWAKFGEFRSECDFRKWAFGVARYEVLAWLRDRGRDRMVLAGDVAEMVADEGLRHAEHFDPRHVALSACLDKLSVLHRELLLASYRPQSKLQDVAASSGRSLGGFYQWLHRMRRLLLDCVQREVAHSSCP